MGISILTNGNRLDYLRRCVSSLLTNCYYRPLRVAILNNGSTDGTKQWLDSLRDAYGIQYKIKHMNNDMGCAAGTNLACDMVRDCEFSLHLESDFEHLPETETGEDKLWMRRAVDFMKTERVDFLYLRRMVDENEMMMHWWSQWMLRIEKCIDGKYLDCPGFWWSNNPHIQRNSTLYDRKTLPLNETIDGSKGTALWSVPEMTAPQPGKTFIHKWGLFVHELPLKSFMADAKGCFKEDLDFGRTKCKYGFFKTGIEPFCISCNRTLDFREMDAHAQRHLSLIGKGNH